MIEARSSISGLLLMTIRSLLPSWSQAASVYQLALPPSVENVSRWLARSSTTFAEDGWIITTPSPRLLPATTPVALAPGFTTCSPQLANQVLPLVAWKAGTFNLSGRPVARVRFGAEVVTV